MGLKRYMNLKLVCLLLEKLCDNKAVANPSTLGRTCWHTLCARPCHDGDLNAVTHKDFTLEIYRMIAPYILNIYNGSSLCQQPNRLYESHKHRKLDLKSTTKINVAATLPHRCTQYSTRDLRILTPSGIMPFTS